MRAVCLLLLLVLSAVACGDSGPDTEYLIITGDDAGSTVEISRDEMFEIRLPSNPTTGFSWSMVPATGVEIGAAEFVSDATDLVGVPGYERFEVTARQSGSHQLVFEYSRPWEDLPPEQVFEIDLAVD